jgi:hypothetical protein
MYEVIQPHAYPSYSTVHAHSRFDYPDPTSLPQQILSPSPSALKYQIRRLSVARARARTAKFENSNEEEQQQQLTTAVPPGHAVRSIAARRYTRNSSICICHYPHSNFVCLELEPSSITLSNSGARTPSAGSLHPTSSIIIKQPDRLISYSARIDLPSHRLILTKMTQAKVQVKNCRLWGAIIHPAV